MNTLWILKMICKPLGCHIFYRSLIIYLVKRIGIFDRAYYLEANNDVAQAGKLPLRHYVSYGDKEGRHPMPLFDPVHYREQARSRTARVNALLHYAYVGRYRKISPSPWFDVDYYLSHNKDIARSHIDPLLHYIRWGGFEGRSPCPQFDGSYYLRAYPDVVEMHINPLIHYLFFGRLEGRNTLPEQNGNCLTDSNAHEPLQLLLPDEASWHALQPRAHIAEADIDVIVPVYKGRPETLRCLYSVLAASSQTPFELVVINDASPDSELTEDLQRLAALKLFTLLSNPENRGFVHTVNRGIQLHQQRHVVLLNADTEVYNGWLDRLRHAAHRN
ncbi:MAG: glycosyltransferase, partial [Methylovulum sp.]